jgi:hypothetical protein
MSKVKIKQIQAFGALPGGKCMLLRKDVHMEE